MSIPTPFGVPYRDAEGGARGAAVADPFAYGQRGGGGAAAATAALPPFGTGHTMPSYPSAPGMDSFGFMPSTASATPSAGVSGSIGAAPAPAAGAPLSYDDDIYDSKSLLEELSVDFGHIGHKVSSVLLPLRPIEDTIMADADMAGPIVFCLGLGFCLLLTGKMHFGYIYGFGAAGCAAMYLLLNLMAPAPAAGIDVSRTFSVLGYGLMPILVIAALAVFMDLRGATGAALGGAAVLWSTTAATRFFEAAMRLQSARYLIAYPALLFYACFALITIF